MSTHEYKKENPSTYMVQDRESKAEIARLNVQDRLLSTVMHGVLAEQPDPELFHDVLDVGCGAGGWVIEAAETYPEMSLTGVDISQRMIAFAHTQAEARSMTDRVEFRVMDALRMLEFPASSFDLVNMRLGGSFVRTWDWPKLIDEFLRIVRSDGIIRVTDLELIERSNSAALTQLYEIFQCALYRAGHIFAQEPAGITDHLAPLLVQYGCKNVQTHAYQLKIMPSTSEAQAYCEDVQYAFHNLIPFFKKRGCAPSDYDAIYKQALKDMRQPDFHATWSFLTAWGSKAI